MKTLLSLFIFISLTLVVQANDSSNFELKNGCFIDIQNLRNSYKKEYYNSLMFEQEMNNAKEQAHKDILKKINLQIQSTATLFYKSSKNSKNGTYLKNKTQEEFKQSIKTTTLDLDINSIGSKEFYCKEDGDLFYLTLIKRDDVYKLTRAKLIRLSKKNKKTYLEINNSNNIMKKLLLHNKIQTNYLPYLMILESAKIDKKLRQNYFKEIKKYQKSYNKFMKNILVFVDVDYSYNKFYSVEDRVDEVRHEVINILSKHSIYASKLPSIDSIETISKNTKKDVALIKIDLKRVNTGYYTLELNFSNTNKPKKKALKTMSSISIKYPKHMQAYEIDFIKSIKDYHTKYNLVKKLSLSGKATPMKTVNGTLAQDTGNKIIRSDEIKMLNMKIR